jgi:hypothetical protein
MRTRTALCLTALVFAGLSCENATAPDTGSIIVQAALPTNTSLSSLRVTVRGSDGETISRSIAPGAESRMARLAPGAYAVSVEGLVGDQTAWFGTTPNVQVAAGREVAAVVGLASFRSALGLRNGDTARVLRFGVSFSRVAGATGYALSWSRHADMSGARSLSLTDTASMLSVARQGSTGSPCAP